MAGPSSSLGVQDAFISAATITLPFSIIDPSTTSNANESRIRHGENTPKPFDRRYDDERELAILNYVVSMILSRYQELCSTKSIRYVNARMFGQSWAKRCFVKQDVGSVTRGMMNRSFFSILREKEK